MMGAAWAADRDGPSRSGACVQQEPVRCTCAVDVGVHDIVLRVDAIGQGALCALRIIDGDELTERRAMRGADTREMAAEKNPTSAPTTSTLTRTASITRKGENARNPPVYLLTDAWDHSSPLSYKEPDNDPLVVGPFDRYSTVIADLLSLPAIR